MINELCLTGRFTEVGISRHIITCTMRTKDFILRRLEMDILWIGSLLKGSRRNQRILKIVTREPRQFQFYFYISV